MLVLSRKKDESIIINGNIKITIIESEDGKVKLGIEAPKSVKIHRQEVFDQIAEQNMASSLNNNMSNVNSDYISKVKVIKKNINKNINKNKQKLL